MDKMDKVDNVDNVDKVDKVDIVDIVDKLTDVQIITKSIINIEGNIDNYKIYY